MKNNTYYKYQICKNFKKGSPQKKFQLRTWVLMSKKNQASFLNQIFGNPEYIQYNFQDFSMTVHKMNVKYIKKKNSKRPKVWSLI